MIDFRFIYYYFSSLNLSDVQSLLNVLCTLHCPISKFGSISCLFWSAQYRLCIYECPNIATLNLDMFSINIWDILRAPQSLCYSFFSAEFGILKWYFHVLFPGYFNVNYSNKMKFYVKFDIFCILKWKCQNINRVIAGLYTLTAADIGTLCICLNIIWTFY